MANEDKAARYHRLRRRATITTMAVDAALLLAASSPTAVSVVAWLAQVSSTESAFFTALYVAALCAVRSLVVGAIAYRTDVSIEQRYRGLEQGSAAWLASYLRSGALTTVVLVAAALVIRAAAGVAGGAWWAVTAAVCAACVLAAGYAIPVALAASASGAGPIRRAELATRLVALAARVGAPEVGVLEWRSAGASSPGAAMLVGVGRRRRVLVSDALLDSHSDDEVEVVVAHELAHYRRGDTWWSAALVVAVATAGLAVAAQALEALGPTWGLSGSADVRALPIVALVCRTVALSAMPLVNAVSRAQERRADRAALEWTENPAALVRTLKRLSVAHLSEERPSRLAEAFFGSHPSVLDRIAAAEAWDRAATSRRPG